MATNTITELKEQFMSDKLYYDGLSQAIRLAKLSGCSDKQIKPLMLLKQQYKKTCANNNERLLRVMPLSQNVIKLQDSWYAVRYVNEKADEILKIDLLKQDSVYLIERDGRHERELSRNEIDTLLPGLIDEEQLELYKQSLQVRARFIINDELGISVALPEEEEEIPEVTVSDVPPGVSVHAGKRWVQRVIGIKSDAEAEEYRRVHWKEITESVLNAFQNASQVWEERAEGISYWLDEANIMYVRGIQGGIPNIITLYEEDFGFVKSINRMIAFEQLAVLTDTHRQLNQSDENVQTVSSQVEAEVGSINDRIAVLESQIALLVAERATQVAQRDQAIKEHKLVKDKYTAEFNKLFKKWDA